MERRIEPNRKPGRRRWLAASSLALATVMLQPMPVMAQATTDGVGVKAQARYDATKMTFTPGTPTPAGTATDVVRVNTSDTLINWVPFDTATGGGPITFLPAGNGLWFVSDGSADYTVVNRILPSDQTRAIRFDGQVSSFTNGGRTIGGNIFFYSPGGIIVGGTGRFDVGSLVLTTSDITPTGSTLGFAASKPGSFVRIERYSNALDTSPQIELGAAGSYLAIVAPRIEQLGMVSVDGSVAYVAAESATLTINNGLFDITVPVGTDDPEGIVHSGTTTGPSSTGAGDNQAIFMVAVPKNDAISMLVGGTLGYASASTAGVVNGKIVLSAGADVTIGGSATDPTVTVEKGSAAPDASIELDGTNFTSDVEGYASDTILAVAQDSDPITMGTGTAGYVYGLSLEAGERIDFGGAKGGSVFIDGDVSLRAGSGATGGTINLVSDGDTGNSGATGMVQIGGDLIADASGAGADDSLASGAGEDALGGTINLTVADGGAFSVAGLTSLLAYADPGVTATSAGSATGGDINVTVSGAGSSLALADVQLQTYARQSGFASTLTGADAASGDITIAVDGGSFTAGGVTVDQDAQAQAGDSLSDAPHDAAGGDFSLTASNGASIAFATLNGSNRSASVGVDGAGNPLYGQAGGGDFSLIADGGSFSLTDFSGFEFSTVGNVAAGAEGKGSIEVTGGGSIDFGSRFSLDFIGFDGNADVAGRSGKITVDVLDGSLTFGDLFLRSNVFRSPLCCANGVAGPDASLPGGVSLTIGSAGSVSGAFLDIDSQADDSNYRAIAKGGDVDVVVDGGILDVGELRIDASGAGGSSDGVGFGQGVGGTVTMTARNDADLDFTSLRIFSNGTANECSSECSSPSSGDGGTGTGGAITLNLEGGTLDAQMIDLAAQGTGGDGSNPFADPDPVRATGGAGVGGAVTVNLAGAQATVGSLTLTADGFGGSGSRDTGGDGGTSTGGSATLNATAGTLDVGSLAVQARGNGTASDILTDGFGFELATDIPQALAFDLSDGFFALGGAGGSGAGLDGGTGGASTGGAATINLGGSATINASDIVIDAQAFGGEGGGSFADFDFVNDVPTITPAGIAGAGGAATGGAAVFNLDGGTIGFSAFTVTASAYGGAGARVSSESGSSSPGGSGGGAKGGSATVNLNQADGSSLAFTIAADGVGGDGGGGAPSGSGGTGEGGVATLAINAGPSVLGAQTLSAVGLGGYGGYGATGGAGGTGRGGTAQVLVGNAAATLAALSLDSSGYGGDGDGSFDIASAGGAGGAGEGGLAKIDVFGVGASLAIGSDIVVTSTGQGGAGADGYSGYYSGYGGYSEYGDAYSGGAGGAGGRGTGGQVSLLARDGATFTLTTAGLIDARGFGGAGGDGGYAYGGTPGAGGAGGAAAGGAIELSAAAAGSLSVASSSGTTTLAADAVGGIGGDGGDSEGGTKANPGGNGAADGGSVSLTSAGAGSSLAFTGDLIADASGAGAQDRRDNATGADASGGAITIDANTGGAFFVSGGLWADATALAAIGAINAGTATGGTIDLTNQSTFDATSVLLDSSALGADGGNGEGGDGGNGVAGAITVTNNGAMAVQDLTIVAEGVGGDGGLRSFSPAMGGNGTGGAVSLTTSSTISDLASLTITATGTGGKGGRGYYGSYGGGGGGRGGAGQGGSILLELTGEGTNLSSLSGFEADVTGTGGKGGAGDYGYANGGAGGAGGDGVGGALTLASRSGATIDFTGFVNTLSADGIGGEGGYGGSGGYSGSGGSGGTGGDGGSGVGGALSLVAQGGSILAGDIDLTATGTGGNAGRGGYGYSSQAPGGANGGGAGGLVSLEALEGSPGVISLGAVDIDASGLAGGGDLSIPTTGGAIVITDASTDPAGLITLGSLTATALGAIPPAAASFTMSGDSGPITVTGDTTLDVAGDIDFVFDGTGRLDVGGATTLNAGGDITLAHGGNSASTQSIASAGDFTAAAAGDFAAGAGSIIASDAALSITAQNISYDLLSAGASLKLNALNGSINGLTGLLSLGSIDLDATGAVSVGDADAEDDIDVNAGGDVSLGAVATENGDLTVNAAGDIVFDAADTVAGDLTFNAGGEVLGGDLAAGGALALAGTRIAIGDGGGATIAMTSGSDILFDSLTSPSSIVLSAPGLIGANLGRGDIDSGGDIVLSSAVIDAGTLTAGGLVQLQATNTIDVLDVNAATTIEFDATGDITAGVLTAGTGMDIATGSSLTLDSAATTSGDLVIGAGQSVVATGAGAVSLEAANGAVAVDAGLDASFASDVVADAIDIAAGGDVSAADLLAQSGIAVDAGGNVALQNAVTQTSDAVFDVGGAISGVRISSLAAAPEGTDDVTLTLGGDLLLSGGGQAFGNYTVDAGGTIDSGDFTAGQTLDLAADDVAIGSGDAGLIAITSNADILFDMLTSGGAIGLTAANGTIAANAGPGRIDSGGDATLAAQAIALGDVTVGGSLDASATGGDASFSAVEAADAITVTAAGTTTLLDAISGGDTRLTASSIDFAAGAIGGDLALTATAGDIDAGGAITVAGGAAFDAAGDIVIGEIDTGDELTVDASGAIDVGTAISLAGTTLTGGSVNLGDADVGGALAIVSTTGDITSAGLLAANTIDLDAAQDVLIANASAGNGIAIEAAGNIGFTDVSTDVGAATLTAGGGVTGTSLAALSNGAGLDEVNIFAGGAVAIGTISAPDNVAVNSASLTSDLVESTASSVLVETTGTIDIDNALSAGNTTLTGSGVTLDAGDIAGDLAVVATDGDIAATGQVAVGGAIGLTAAGNIGFGSLVAEGGDFTADAGGAITFDSASAAGDLVFNAGTGLAASGDVTAGGTVALGSTNGAVSLRDIFAGGSVQSTGGGSFTARDIVQTGGSLSISNVGGVTLRDASGASDIGLTTSGGLSFGALTTPGEVSLLALGDLAGTSISGGGDISVDGFNVDIANIATTNGTIFAIADGGALAVGGIAGDFDVFLEATGALDVDTIDAGGLIDIDAGTADLGAATAGTDIAVRIGSKGGLVTGALVAGGSIAIDAGDAGISGTTLQSGLGQTLGASGDIAFADATAGGTIDLAAGGAVTAERVMSDADIAIGAGDAVAIETISAGGGASVNAASLTSDVLEAGGLSLVETTGAIDLGNAISGASTSLTGSSVLLDNAAIGGALAITATVGDIASTGQLDARGGIDFDAAQDVAVTEIISSAPVTIDAAGRIGFTDLSTSAGGATLVAGGDVTGTSLVTIPSELADSISITSGGAVEIDTISAGQSIVVDAASLKSDLLQAEFGANTVETGGSIDIGEARSAAGTTLTGSSVTLGDAAIGGALTITATEGDIASSGRIDVSSSADLVATGDIGFGTLTGDVVDVDAGGNINFGSAMTDSGTLSITAGGNISGTSVINATPEESVGENDEVQLDAGGTVTLTGTSRTGGDFEVSAGGAISIADLTAGDDAKLFADGAITLNEAAVDDLLIAEGSSVLIRSSNALTVEGRAAEGDFDISTTGDLTVRDVEAAQDALLQSTGGSVFIVEAENQESSVPGTQAALALAPDGGEVSVSASNVSIAAADDVVVEGEVYAGQLLSIDAGGRLELGNAASGALIDALAGDIAIFSGGSLGDATRTQAIDISSFGDVALGGEGGGFDGFELDNDEFGRIFSGGSLAIASLAESEGTAMLLVRDLSIAAGGGNGQIGAAGGLFLVSDGTVDVDGAVTVANATADNRLSIEARDTIDLDYADASLRIEDSAGSPTGMIDLTANRIEFLSDSARADIEGAAVADINDRLGQSDGDRSEGLIEAGDVTLNAIDAVLIQNTGISAEFDDRRGIRADTLTINGAPDGSTVVIVNGVVAGATGTDAIPIVTQGSPFAAGSTINGCDAADPASCIAVVPPPPPPEEPEIEFNDPAADLIEEEFEPGVELDPVTGSPLIDFAEPEEFADDPLINDPVTGAGNDDLWVEEPECEPGDAGSCPAPDEDQPQDGGEETEPTE